MGNQKKDQKKIDKLKKKKERIKDKIYDLVKKKMRRDWSGSGVPLETYDPKKNRWYLDFS